jgi:hypothetical protein
MTGNESPALEKRATSSTRRTLSSWRGGVRTRAAPTDQRRPKKLKMAATTTTRPMM